jgi:hypothetical protein
MYDIHVLTGIAIFLGETETLVWKLDKECIFFKKKTYEKDFINVVNACFLLGN